MNFQFLLFQSIVVSSIASFAYGGKLPTSVTSQYTYCYELRKFYSDVPSHDSLNIDNICMDLDKSALHFLASAQGGETSHIATPISEIIVPFFFRDALGIMPKMPSESPAGLHCTFKEPAHLLDVYNSIYQDRRLNRENVTISRIQEFLIHPNTSDRITDDSELSQQAVLYTESFKDNTQTIFTFRKRSNGRVGDTVLVFVANIFNISDVVINDNVVLNSSSVVSVYFVLTFPNDFEANYFRDSLGGYFKPNTLKSIPPALYQVLNISAFFVCNLSQE